LGIGAAILIFSQNAELLKEVDEANQGRRGAKWKPANYVAAKLEERFGDTLPGAKWMSACARAAELVKARGMFKGSIEKLLGWRDGPDDALTNINIRESNPDALLGFGGESSDDKKDPKKVEEMVQGYFEFLQKKTLDLAANAKAKISYRDLKPHLDRVNKDLALIGLAIGPRGK
jgi:hypothetical protein